MSSKGVLSEKKSLYDDRDRVKTKNNGLPDKRFTHRESLLTVMFENLHLRTVHHCFMALLLGLVLTTILKDFLEQNEIFSGFRLIFLGFGKLYIALASWAVYFCLYCCAYFCFKLWAMLRIELKPQSDNLKMLLDYAGIIILLGYYAFSFRLATYIVWGYQLPPASASIILIEQTRILMKLHAFVRSNVPKVIYFKQKSDNCFDFPTFKHFVYFFFAPTLVYRDEYPRTKGTRWNIVFNCLVEIAAVILLYSFVMERFLVPIFKDFGLRKWTYSEVFLTVLETSLPGSLYLLATFYLILHLVQNLFAEVLRFGDRMFYKDWWTATDYATFHRKWNVVVHDWLYEYLYKDCYESLVPGNKLFAKYVTFFISAIVHEWILMNMFGFFFPVMFLLHFVFGSLLTFVKVPDNSLFNVLYLLSVGYGAGIMVSGYIVEFFVRYNGIPPLYQDFDFYLPRCVTCDCFV